MARNSDAKETERTQYLQDLAHRVNVCEEIASLKNENKKLKMEVAQLKNKLKRYKDK